MRLATLAIPVALGLAACVALGLSGCKDSGGGSSGEPTPVDLDIAPVGLANWPSMPIPIDNPTTAEGIELGRHLFHDPILSGDDTQSCSSCHSQGAAFSDNGRQFSIGIDGIAGTFNAPALVNLGWTSAAPYAQQIGALTLSMFWNGRAESLEAQALEPVPNPIEMHLAWPDAEAKIQAAAKYPPMFQAAFGTKTVTRELVTKALAQFQRSLRSYNSKWDRAQRGEVALTQAEMDGFTAFSTETGDCWHCHGGNLALFVNPATPFANNGLDSLPDPGVMTVTGQPSDEGVFRVVTLRNLAYTAPYMHDGRFATLEEVLDHYSTGVALDSPNLQGDLRARVLTFGPISDVDKANIIAFLGTLNDPTFVSDPAFGPP